MDTENVPDVITVMDCVVAPFDQTLFELEEEVNTTLSPEQNSVSPLALIVGVGGSEFTVTTVAVESGDVHKPLEAETVYDPVVETVMD